MNLLIADDHPIVRNGIKDIINELYPSAIIDEARDTQEVIKKVILNNYDLIILDISMPGGGGLNALDQILKSNPNNKVLMLSMYSDEQYINRSLKLGAAGYLTKSVAAEELGMAIRKIMNGEKYLCSEVVSKMTSYIYSGNEKLKHELLSEREFQVFIGIVNGEKTSEIGDKLNISPKTVSTYRERVMFKLEMKKNSELVQYAIRNKLIT